LILGAGQISVAAADPTITSEPTYCTGTNCGPEAGARQDGKDTVQATADIQCDQTQYLEVIFTTTGDGHSWTDDLLNTVTTSGKLFITPHHKVGSDLEGQVYTVNVTVKVFAGSAFCQDSQHCYPFGTPRLLFPPSRRRSTTNVTNLA
jgi:hypothetical protein